MNAETVTNQLLSIVIGVSDAPDQPSYYVAAIEMNHSGQRERILEGIAGQEFATTVGSANAATCEKKRTADGGWEIRLQGRCDAWEASEIITLSPKQPIAYRQQTYRFHQACEAAIQPGFRIQADPDIRYTFPLRAHEQPLADLKPMRTMADWALPLPFHVWHNEKHVALYGLDKSVSVGTLDFTPVADGYATLRAYFPDTCPQKDWALPAIPGATKFAVGEEVTMTEVFAARPLVAGEEPLLEAERLAAEILFRQSGPRD